MSYIAYNIHVVYTVLIKGEVSMVSVLVLQVLQVKKKLGCMIAAWICPHITSAWFSAPAPAWVKCRLLETSEKDFYWYLYRLYF